MKIIFDWMDRAVVFNFIWIKMHLKSYTSTENTVV